MLLYYFTYSFYNFLAAEENLSSIQYKKQRR